MAKSTPKPRGRRGKRGTPERWDVDEPHVRSVDIISWLYRTRPGTEFTARDIAQAFEITEADARGRLAYMRVAWRAVVKVGAVEAHQRGRRQHQYVLTAWGKKYAARRMKRRRAAANTGEGE